jgi:hypothetical protein
VQIKAMARLLSVNVGLPRDITWQGKTVHAAIGKRRSNAGGWCGGEISTATAKVI